MSKKSLLRPGRSALPSSRRLSAFEKDAELGEARGSADVHVTGTDARAHRAARSPHGIALDERPLHRIRGGREFEPVVARFLDGSRVVCTSTQECKRATLLCMQRQSRASGGPCPVTAVWSIGLARAEALRFPHPFVVFCTVMRQLLQHRVA
jgi:hypothetical protein